MLIKLSPRYGLDFTDDEVDRINSHRLSKAEDGERQGRARGREEEEREGKCPNRKTFLLLPSVSLFFISLILTQRLISPPWEMFNNVNVRAGLDYFCKE